MCRELGSVPPCAGTDQQLQRQYMSDHLADAPSENNTKPFWRYIKSMRTDNQGVSPIKAHGALHIQPQQKAELLNDQFRSVFTMEDTTCPVPIPEGPSTSNITPLSITTAGIKKLLSSININKAAGPDQIPFSKKRPTSWHQRVFILSVFDNRSTA